MKSLSLFVSAAALLSASSVFALDCGTLPTCESLGYKDKKAECPASKFLICPFDENMGKCMHDAAIGDLKYSLKSTDHDGWILCDGRTFSSDSTAKYYELFKVIGNNFCHKYTSKTDTSYSTSNCSSGMFAVPDYRGFFLRGVTSKRSGDGISQPTSQDHGYAADYMTGNLTASPYLARTEELPNITGDWWAQSMMRDNASRKASGLYEENGALYLKPLASAVANMALGNSNHDFYLEGSLGFDASKTPGTGKGVYKDGGYVLPAHYAAYIFIYAGR